METDLQQEMIIRCEDTLDIAIECLNFELLTIHEATYCEGVTPTYVAQARRLLNIVQTQRHLRANLIEVFSSEGSEDAE
jgi:hypothetical protein